MFSQNSGELHNQGITKLMANVATADLNASVSADRDSIVVLLDPRFQRI